VCTRVSPSTIASRSERSPVYLLYYYYHYYYYYYYCHYYYYYYHYYLPLLPLLLLPHYHYLPIQSDVVLAMHRRANRIQACTQQKKT
jgi:hypothetical protein